MDSRVVKGLNKNPSCCSRRFIFKSFWGRIAETTVDVFHSLDHVKAEPSSSSFFLDCLIQWRELNTAEDFMSFYEETMPIAQTLPLVVLNNELIVSKLLSRLQMRARLSLEPILRLIAELARDLLEDFITYLPRIINCFLGLLKEGADKEPDIIEQIFTCLSHIMMYLQKYLTKDVLLVLRDTIQLRYYPKDFVQEFMAEALSFLLRNAPIEQLRIGIEKVMCEVAEEPSKSKQRNSGVTAMLCHIMKGTASKLHSKADKVLQMLMDESLFIKGEKFNQGVNTIAEVMSCTFQRLCKETNPQELKLVLNCLYCRIHNCLINQSFLYLPSYLSVLISTLSFEKGTQVFGDDTLLRLVNSLIGTFFKSPFGGMKEDQMSEVVSRILQLMSCILDGLHNLQTISLVEQEWTSAFELRTPSLLSFLQELVHKNPEVLFAFRNNILRACTNSMYTSKDEVVYLILTFCEKLRLQAQEGCTTRIPHLEGIDKKTVLEISQFFQEEIKYWINRIKKALENGDSSYARCDEKNLPSLWGIIHCYPHFLNAQEDASLLMDLVVVVDQLLMAHSDNSQRSWQHIIGASISSVSIYHKLDASNTFAHTSRMLDIAKGKTNKSSSHILCAVADFLDLIYGPPLNANVTCMIKHPELESAKLRDALDLFADNLLNAEKRVRVSTLRLLCHYDPLGDECMIHNGTENMKNNNVLKLLLSIEEAPISVDTSRMLTQLVSKIQSGLSDGKVSKSYIPVVLRGIIGIFHNQFRDLSMSALECLVVLLDKYHLLVWDEFVHMFEKFLVDFLSGASDEDDIRLAVDSTIETHDIEQLFHSFASTKNNSKSCSSILSFMLQALQKVPMVAEAGSSEIKPLLLRFLDYGVWSPASRVCKKKAWKVVLIEWLSLLQVLRNPTSFGQDLKMILVNRFLDEKDVVVQMKVFDCLLNWKDDFLLQYSHQLKNLISSKTLQEELATWSLSNESDVIEDEHRKMLVPYVIRLLMPKVRNLKTVSSRKRTSISGRQAILRYISQLDVSELPLFYTLLMKPLQITEDVSDITADDIQSINFFNIPTLEKITALHWKTKYGFLHVLEDILGVFDELHVRPFLNLLAGCVVRILYSCQQTCVKQLDLRKQSLKIISNVLYKYEDHNFGSDFWCQFFASVMPIINTPTEKKEDSVMPRSVLSCFLAMSRNQNLAALLFRESDLVSTIISILSVSSASTAIITDVLKFIENLFHLDAADENGNSDFRNALLSNVPVLIKHLHCLSYLKRERKRRSVKRPSEISLAAMRILKLLSSYIEDPKTAKQTVHILLPFLDGVARSPDASMEALHILRKLVPVLGSDTKTKILESLASVLVVAKELDMRLSVCGLLEALAENDSSLLSTAKLVCQLNATSAMDVNELDFDVITKAYDQISVEFFQINAEHANLILSHCIHDMTSEELSLRHSAHRSLLIFGEFSARVAKQEEAGSNEEKKGIQFLLNCLGDVFSGGLSIQKEWIDLLGEMILLLPENPDLNALKALCSDNPDKDFFHNITHLQMHRRARALRRFRDAVRSGELPVINAEKFFLPFFKSMLFEIKKKDGGLTTACLEALASLSGKMEWQSYCDLLTSCFSDLDRVIPERRVVLLRLITFILDEFHFQDSTTDHDEVTSFVLKTVFPKLKKLLNSDSDKVNIDVSLAALKVLKLLPSDEMQSQLPSIILRTVNFLRNRLESTRDEARSAVAGCLKELGPDYLPFVIKSLRATLKRGFELHVLGYTLNFVLSKGLQDSAGGELDCCLDVLLSVIGNDILGDVSDQKEVEKIASKSKESRRQMSFKTLELVAQNVSFENNALKLLSPVMAYMHKHLTPKTKTKLSEMLKHIAAGLERNPSANEMDFFVYIFGLIDQESHLCYADAELQGWHLITVFALQLFRNRLMNKKVDEQDQVFVQILNPFVKLLPACLNSKYEEILSATFQCISQLIKFPSISLAYLDVEIKSILIDRVAQSSSNLNSPVTEACLRPLTKLLRFRLKKKSKLLRGGDKVTLSRQQLRILVQFIVCVDLERNPSFVVLSLLKEIVGRELVVSEIFDLALTVAKLMITSQNGPIRKLCSQIFLLFLRKDTLGGNRRTQYIDFLINNLSYEHATGREAVLEVFTAFVRKSKKKSDIDKLSPYLFVNLVRNLSRDPDNRIRSLIASAIRVLVKFVSPTSLNQIIKFSHTWYMDKKKEPWGVSAQVLGLIVEEASLDFQEYIKGVLLLPDKEGKNRMNCVLQIAVANASGFEHSDQRMTSTGWKEAYYSLVLFEKIMVKFPELINNQHVEDLWKTILELLIHPHLWIRSITNRLFSLYFKQMDAAVEKQVGTTYLTSPDKLFRIAVSQCCQLKKGELSTDAVKVLESNIVYTLVGIHNAAIDSRIFPSNLDRHEQVRLLEAASQLLGSSLVIAVNASLTSSNDHEQQKDLCQLLVSSLLETMGKIALNSSSQEITTKAVLSCFDSVALKIGTEICVPYGIKLLHPLYRICEGFVGKPISEELKQHVEIVRRSIEKVMGSQQFAQTYSQLRSELKLQREMKKQNEKRMAVVDPVRNAKRKLRAAAKHKANKKRKIMTFKFGRCSTLPIQRASAF